MGSFICWITWLSNLPTNPGVKSSIKTTVCSLNSQLVGGPLIPPCPSWSLLVRVKDNERQRHQTGRWTILLQTVGTSMPP